MLLIYVPKLTNRVGYTINVVMRDILRTDFAITTDKEVFERHQGARLCYAPQPVFDISKTSEEPPFLFLKSSELLFETSIEEKDCHFFTHEGQPALFPVFNRHAALPFDPLAAIFYMLSRYEEYLPHHRDEHGREIDAGDIADEIGQSAEQDKLSGFSFSIAFFNDLVHFFPSTISRSFSSGQIF